MKNGRKCSSCNNDFLWRINCPTCYINGVGFAYHPPQRNCGFSEHTEAICERCLEGIYKVLAKIMESRWAENNFLELVKRHI